MFNLDPFYFLTGNMLSKKCKTVRLNVIYSIVISYFLSDTKTGFVVDSDKIVNKDQWLHINFVIYANFRE